MPENLSTSQSGELGGILHITKTVPLHLPVTLVISSTTIIHSLTKNLQQHEERGWIDVSNAQIFIAIVAALRKRSATTILKPWSDYPEKRNKVLAEDLAKLALDKDLPDHIDISIPHEFSSHGIRVVTATQRLLYRGIQQG